jgi:hypothetical protein
MKNLLVQANNLDSTNKRDKEFKDSVVKALKAEETNVILSYFS